MGYITMMLELTPKQRRTFTNAVRDGTGVKLKFSYNQLTAGGDAKLYITTAQKKHLEKAIRLRKGAILTLSKKQIHAMKTGGFLPMLLGALVSSLAPTLFNRLFPEKNDQDGHNVTWYWWDYSS